MRLWSSGKADGLEQPTLGRLVTAPVEDMARRRDAIPYGSAAGLMRFGRDWAEYAAILCSDPQALAKTTLRGRPPAGLYAPPNLDYLGDGDVVLLQPSGDVRVMYRRTGRGATGGTVHNTILTTERCNSFCLMCSQPPRQVDDSYRVGMILRLLELIDPGAPELVISGGEPTLLGDGFFAILEKARERLPLTALHVLTNGRRFSDAQLAARLGAVRHPDLVLGVPLYSDLGAQHDYVVQARGAYDETLAGFYNLAAAGVRLEVRVVLHRQTVGRLPELAAFIARNLPFVEHVALMGLEMYGFTPRNLDVLWIDPFDYQLELTAAVEALALAGMNVSIYNHQLCTIPRALWPFARKSISDWKNVYLDACSTCGVRDFCGGFFQSATKRHSAHIVPCAPLGAAAASVMAAIHSSPSAWVSGPAEPIAVSLLSGTADT